MPSDAILIAEITDLRSRLAASEAEVEKYRMKIAAISTASVQNTETTRKDRIEPGHEYWTVAYGDVCAAVDREMAHRVALAESERKREEAERAHEELVRAAREWSLARKQWGPYLEECESLERAIAALPPAKKSQEGA